MLLSEIIVPTGNEQYLLIIKCSDFNSFFIVENWQIYCSMDVILGKL
jgi:hypothetical protein